MNREQIEKVKAALDFLCRRLEENGLYSPALQPVVLEAQEALRGLEAGEPVATIQGCDPYDEREGARFSLEDLMRLDKLPKGTKLYADAAPAGMVSELAALRDQFAVMEEARDAEMLKVANRDAEIAELRTKLDGYKRAEASHQRNVREIDELLNGKEGMAQQASLCDILAQLHKELPALRTRAEEAERKLADARREGMEEAAKIAEGTDVFLGETRRQVVAAIRARIGEQK